MFVIGGVVAQYEDLSSPLIETGTSCLSVSGLEKLLALLVLWGWSWAKLGNEKMVNNFVRREERERNKEDKY